MGMRYFIFKTRLRNQTNYYGRIILNGTLDQGAFVDRLLKMGTSLTKTDIMAVLNLVTEGVDTACREGYKVNLNGLVQFFPVLAGPFSGKSDTFDPHRNNLTVTAQVAQALNVRVATKVKLERVVIDTARPTLVDVTDSEVENSGLTPGHITVVSGKNLKFDPSRPGEYLRLVNSQNPLEFLPVTSFHKIGNRELVFRLPSAPFSKGYFEAAVSLGTRTLRTGRSADFPILGSWSL